MKVLSFIALCFFTLTACAQDTKTEVITLGVFHLNFPNLDVNKISNGDQIDVLEPVYQNQIIGIVNKIYRFRPTIIVIERQPAEQHKTDSTFNAYKSGSYDLKRNEEEQIGFRLAKLAGAKII